MNLVDVIKSGDAGRTAELLASDGSLASERTPEGVSYICLAMYHRQPEIARMIAAQRRDLDIFEACSVGDSQRVADLIANGAGESYSPDGFTPIALAAYLGHPHIVRLLAEAGVDLNAQARNPMKVAAIHAAVAARSLESVQILLQHGADPNLKQQQDYTPLQAAEANGDSQIIEVLKAHGAH